MERIPQRGTELGVAAPVWRRNGSEAPSWLESLQGARGGEVDPGCLAPQRSGAPRSEHNNLCRKGTPQGCPTTNSGGLGTSRWNSARSSADNRATACPIRQA